MNWLRNQNLRPYFLGIFVLCCLYSTALRAREDREAGVLCLTDKVVDENKRGSESTIYVYRNKKLDCQFETSHIGKFNVDVKTHNLFFVWKDAPVSLRPLGLVFPFFIDLYPFGKSPSLIDLERSVGKILDRVGQFIYDSEFTKKANLELKKFVRERKDLRVRDYSTKSDE
jgi:hypothetical protein